MVPQEVPVANEIIEPMRKSIAGTKLAGMMSIVESTMKVEVPRSPHTPPTPQAQMMITSMPAIFLMPPIKVSNTSLNVISFCLIIMIPSVMEAKK